MRYRIWIKFIAWVLLITMTAQLIPATLLAGEGPAKPEAASFEPVDTSDLVSLYSGDFSYNVPLMEIPGPEGNWPINVYYHGGIGPNTEATWTGLGWNLSPGAINRFVSGVPDDSWGGLTETYYWKRKAKGWGVGLAISWGPVGMNMSYDSQMGFGYNASLSVIGAIASMIPSGGAAKSGAESTAKGAKAAEAGAKAAETGIKAGKAAAKAFAIKGDAQINMSSSTGVGMSMNISMKLFDKVGISAAGNLENASADLSVKGVKLAKFSFSSSSEGAKFSSSSSGAKSQSSATSGHTEKFGFFIPLPLSLINKALPDLAISYYQWKWWLNELHEDRSYGIIHQLGYLREEDNPSTDGYALENVWGSQSDNVIEKLRRAQEIGNVSVSMAKYSAASNSAPTPKDYIYSKKLERDFVNEVIVSSEDIYQVNAQGISGLFQPFFSWPYKVYDIKDDDNKKDGKFDRIGYNNYGSEIKFRFLDDMGGHFLNKTGGSGGSFMGRYGSRIIHPAINVKTGLIEGFEIIADDGRVYEFYQPVFNYYQFSETVHRDAKNRNKDRCYVKQSTPYASSWLLTGIKGPDYVDVTNNGFSEDDFGFWVKFTYKKSDGIIPWRSPFTGIIVPDDNPYGEAYSYGARQNMYLYSIETATHVALFATSDRDDNRSPVVTEGLEFGCLRLRDDDGDETSANGGQTFISYFNKQMIDQYLSSNFDAMLRITHSYERYDYSDPDDNGIYSYINTQNVSNFITTMNINLSSQSNISTEDEGTAEIHFDFPYTQYLNNESHPPYAHRKIKEAVLVLTPKSQASYSQRSKKLDRIILYKKKLYNDGTINAYKINTTATFSGDNPQLESVEFGYDYSLCNYSPNSTATTKGKLTLKSITKKGLNGFSYLPPTQFTYENNPTYDANKYDFWNGYTSTGTNSNHLNSQNKEQANRDAGAWSLSSILTPLGSSIRINYESDEVAYVGTHFIGEYSNTNPNQVRSKIANEPGITSTIILENDDANIAGLFALGYRKFKLAHETSILQDYYYEDQSTGQSTCSPTGNTSYEVTPVTVTSIANNQAVINSEYTFLSPEGDLTEGNCSRNYTDHTYYLIPMETTIYAGGHRVGSISVEDGGDIRKTIYRYQSGSSPSLPEGYISLVDKSLLQSSGFNQLGASPGVGYAQVEVFDVDPNTNEILNGKMLYEFWTSKDKPFTVQHNKPSGGPDNLIIKDRTGIYGKMKSIKSYAIKQGKAGYDPSDYYLVKEDKIAYAYNDELPYPAVTDANGYANYAYTMGMSQRKYQSKNENDHETYIDHRFMNLYTINSSTTNYTYDLNEVLTGSFTTWSDNIKFDAFTGNVLATQMRDSKGNYMIRASTPAHWNYPALLEKNMLTQSATQAMYELPSGKKFNAMAHSELRYYLKSFSVTTWKNWGNETNQVWAINDQFEATKFGSFFIDFNRWNDFNNESLNPSLGDFFIGWKRTSNITEVDRYGHPVEERGLTGQYTSSIYGYRDVLPVAIAQNARRSEIKYYNFEDRVSASSYTGKGSAAYNNSTIDGQSIVAPTTNTGNEKFILTAWILPVGQSQWQYFQTTLDPLQAASFNGTGIVDDIRIYPKSATMSTFGYDPVTYQLTSITDGNNMSTFYEYDGAGRLIKVYDHDRNLVQRHSYQYKRQ